MSTQPDTPIIAHFKHRISDAAYELRRIVGTPGAQRILRDIENGLAKGGEIERRSRQLHTKGRNRSGLGSGTSRRAP
jgi:hypothetical protein